PPSRSRPDRGHRRGAQDTVGQEAGDPGQADPVGGGPGPGARGRGPGQPRCPPSLPGRIPGYPDPMSEPRTVITDSDDVIRGALEFIDAPLLAALAALTG